MNVSEALLLDPELVSVYVVKEVYVVEDSEMITAGIKRHQTNTSGDR